MQDEAGSLTISQLNVCFVYALQHGERELIKSRTDRSLRRQHSVTRSAFCATLTLLLAACGGGGSDGPGSTSNDSSNGGAGIDPFPSVSLNGAVTGRLFESDRATYLDLETGETVQLAGDNAYPSADGLTVIELHENARFALVGCGGGGAFYDRIVFRDALSGLASHSIELAGDIHGPIRLSPDGLSVALFLNLESSCSSGSNLTTLTMAGDVTLQLNEDINSVDWLPDSRLVATYNQIVGVQVEPNVGTFRRIANMESIVGSPGRVAVSPDGSQVLFEMITGGSPLFSTVDTRDATVWAVNIDGSNLRQLVTSSREDLPDTDFDDPRVNMPAWSPDSDSFLVTEDYISGGIVFRDDFNFGMVDVLPVSNDGLTYIVPANTAPLRLPPQSFSATGVRPIAEKNLNGQIGISSIRPFHATRWVQAQARQTVAFGALPNANGLVNRGLSGQMYLMGENDNDNPTLQSIDLRSGAVSEHTVFLDDDINHRDSLVAVSTGATHTAHLIDERVNEKYLRVFDASGQLLNDLVLISNNYHYPPETAIRFSPVSNDHLAWIYDDDNFGTGAIVWQRSTNRFVAIWDGFDYDAITWSKEGNLLVFDEGRVYQSVVNNGVFGNLELLFEINDIITHPDVNPVTNDIAFTSSGQIFAVGLNGQNLRRLVANADDTVEHPSWSTDGQYLSVRMGFDGFVVAADTLNARIYDDEKSVGAFRIGEGVSARMPVGRSRFEWR